VDGNGPDPLYIVYVMENGDKFFARTDGVVQNASGKRTATQVGSITGGTGKFAAIHGIVRLVAIIDQASMSPRPTLSTRSANEPMHVWDEGALRVGMGSA
jgi:hypothetical protein